MIVFIACRPAMSYYEADYQRQDRALDEKISERLHVDLVSRIPAESDLSAVLALARC